MRNILILMSFVALGVSGGFLCKGYYRDAVETKLEKETRQQLSELDQPGVDVECDHLFATLKFEPSFALVEQKEIAGRIKSRGVYVGTAQSLVAEKETAKETVAAVQDETTTIETAAEVTPEASTPETTPEIIEEIVAPEPEPKLAPELFVYLNRENHMILEGRFPNTIEKDVLVGRLEEMYTENDVIDMITIASNVDDLPWDRPDELILNLIGLVDKGSVAFSGSEVTLAGKTYSQSVKRGLNDLATLVVGADGTIINKLRSVAPVAKAPIPLFNEPTNEIVAQRVTNVFEEQAIYFRSGSTRLSEKDLAKIQVIAQSIEDFDPSQKLIVGGYADQTGDPDSNRRLSLKRASVVREQLEKLGVATDRLIVKHFGEDTSKLSKDEMWQSRRVELSLSDN